MTQHDIKEYCSTRSRPAAKRWALLKLTDDSGIYNVDVLSPWAATVVQNIRTIYKGEFVLLVGDPNINHWYYEVLTTDCITGFIQRFRVVGV